MTNGQQQHVDLVKNEWLAGFQLVVARSYHDGHGRLWLEGPEEDRERWEHLLRQPQVDRRTREEIDPQAQGAEFFGRLHDLLNGDYLFATDAHSDDECPYRGHMVVPIRQVGQEAHEAHYAF